MNPSPRNVVYLLALLGAVYTLFTSSSGGVFGKSTAGCGGAGCHQNAPTTQLNVTGIPASGYVNGTPYTITLTVANAAKSKAGFNLTVNDGTLTAGPGMMLNGPRELKHTSPLNMVSGVSTWTFTWTAPPTGVNPVIFFVAGNSVDGNNQSSNDEFDTNQFQFSCAASSTVPSITNGSVTVTSECTVNADVNANGASTTVTIEYGLTTSYGSSISANPGVVTGTSPVPVSAVITGLNPGTLYYCRVVATNSNGTVTTNDIPFTTQAANAIQDLEVSGVQVFPNPAASVLEYHDRQYARPAKLELRNMMGMPVQTELSTLAPGHYRLRMDHLPAGLYFLMAESEGTIRVKRIIHE
jgi:hypothetical protein